MTSALLACSGGGHLKQLFTLTERIGIRPEDQHWITFENGLSKSLLADREVMFVPFAAPRDGVNITRIAMATRRLLKSRDFGLAISTGSGPAVAVLPQTARAGIPTHFIESAARADGPSMSGRLVSHFPRIVTYSQYPAWAGGRWLYRGSIFDAWQPGAVTPGAKVRRVVVTVGTQEGYGFDRLFRHLAPLLRDAEVLWQTGDQDVSAFGIEGRGSVPHAELKQAVQEADVVVAHSGTGSAITAIESGKCPILVPRLARFKEHVDDHQVQIAQELSRRGLALMSHAEDLSAGVLREAAARSTTPVTPPPFELVQRSREDA